MTADQFMLKFASLWMEFQQRASDAEVAEARDALQDWHDDNFGLDLDDDDDDDWDGEEDDYDREMNYGHEEDDE